MKKFLFAALLMLGALPANAQQHTDALIVSACGTLPVPYVAGTYNYVTMDTTGKLCDSGSGGGGGGTQNVNLTQILGAAPSATNPLWVSPATGATFPVSAASLPLPTGAATQTTLAAILAAQGAAPAQQTGATVGIVAGSAVIGKVGIDQTTPGTTNAVSATNFPSTVATGTGAQGATVPRVTVATDQATNAGAALVKGGVGVVNGGSTYQAVAASQTATVLQTSTGAIGDYLSHCVIYPTSTSPGVVTVFDNTNAAGTNVIAFPGGASSVSNLVPIAVPVGAVSTAGAWKVTTGANVSAVCYGKFS